MKPNTDSNQLLDGDGCKYCYRKPKSRGMCSGHYERYRKGLRGPELTKLLTERDPGRVCQVCGGPYHAKGLCNVHYMLKYHGKDGHLLRPCMVPECGTKAKARDFCGGHYYIYQKYGLTGEEYLMLLENCGYRCQICGAPQKKEKRGRLCVDHCHTTGKIRGMLCNGCNRGLGLLGEHISQALKYLARISND